MERILSRLLVRVAILAASLAWAGFVFTQTIGDPGRGERIATAVLADAEARAEVSAPITRAVMTTTGLPADQQPLVAGQVDLLLQDPDGARTFVDPFAGSWARLLGEDDPRPAEFDLVPLLEDAATSLPPGTVDTSRLAAELPVTGVPLPRARLDWMSGVRDAISVSLLPLALVATGSFLAAFLIGDRRRVLRRFAVWAGAAGLAWVVIPPLLVWAARRWASGADAVVAVSLDEATAGLLPAAVGLVAAGVAAFAVSFVVAPTGDGGRATRPTTGRAPDPVRSAPMPSTRPGPARAASARRTAPTRAVPVTPTMPSARRIGDTAEIPVTRVAQRTPDAPADRTVEMPAVARTDRRAGDDSGDDRDALWDYYGSS